MSIRDFNPESVISTQVREHWQKLTAMLVWKLARDGVTLTLADMQRFAEESERGEAVLMQWGHQDSIEFKIVNRAEAQRLAAHDQQQRGRA